MTGRIQQDGLWSGINAACRRDGGIEGYRDIHVELILYFLRRIFIVIQDYDGERDFIPVFPYKRFEIGHVEAGTRTVRVKEMKEYRFAAGNGQFPTKVDKGARPDRVILLWNRCRKAIFPVSVPEDIGHTAKNSQQPCYGNCLFHQYWMYYQRQL